MESFNIGPDESCDNKTDCYGSVCDDMDTGSGHTRSEPNHILEINEAHADNWLLVIPKLPTSTYLSSQFNDLTKPKTFFDDYTCTAQSPSTTGTSGTSGNPPVDSPCDEFDPNAARREANLDLANFKLYLSDVTMPQTSVNAVTLGTQFADINRASKIQQGDLQTTMMISENFLNYNALLFWEYALHNPEEYNKIYGRHMIEEFFTEIYLIITNNHRQKIAEYRFIDCFPNNLTPLPFSYKNADKLTMDVTWKHSGMVPSDNFVLKYV